MIHGIRRFLGVSNDKMQVAGSISSWINLMYWSETWTQTTFGRNSLSVYK